MGRYENRLTAEQFEELSARFYYSAYLFNRLPEYTFMPVEGTTYIEAMPLFEISPEGDKTRLTFTHQGLVPAIECYGGCSVAWQSLIEKSLFSYIQTGKGVAVF
ncbi:hypothetical protein [Pedobacter jeongneungensis]|uniref:hypothetical protein n=1 Tax=Pedobacter jeongneungensis TaxID=947309 RepID=UPI00046A7816|nr:hypothetical protein [Pedobacter jeongneungensis]